MSTAISDVLSVVLIFVLLMTSSTAHYSHWTDCEHEGAYRAVPGTQCVNFQVCQYHKWSNYNVRMCVPTTLWANDANTCMPSNQVDTTTCTLKTSHSGPHTPKPTTATTTYPTLTSEKNSMLKYCGRQACYYGTCGFLFSGGQKCTCYSGYEGNMCHELKITNLVCSTTLNWCYHGQCVFNYVTELYGCNCYHGYSGEQCRNRATSNQHTPPSTIARPTTAARPTTNFRPTTTAIPTTTRTTIMTNPSTTTTTAAAETTTAAKPPRTTHSTTFPTASVGSTQAVIKFTSCQNVATVLDLGNHRMSTNANLTRCPSGSSATPEAFVIDHCFVSEPSAWTQGANVMQQCQLIPLYTPVATFSNHQYVSSGSLSGIFLGCLSDGFKLGVQRCDNPPEIIHIVKGGQFTMDPNLYYTTQ